MKKSLFRAFFVGSIFAVILFGSIAIAASTGTIDPTGSGAYKAAFLDPAVVTDTGINFGKFTTESAYNITVSDTELRGYAWGSSVGYMVMNCFNTTSGCSSTNGNFKVANDSTGKLSGYAWGDNTGWINFGPFTDTSISTVKIGSNGNFGGTSGSAGYAWSQNFGWIIFDCSNANTCVNTDWRQATGGTSGGGVSGGGTPVTNPSTPPGTVIPGSGIPSAPPTVPPNFIGLVASSVVCDVDGAMPHWGKNGNPNIGPNTAIDFVNNSNGHCHFTAGQSFQWAHPGTADGNVVYGEAPNYTTFGPTDASGTTSTITPITTGNPLPLREVLQPGYIPFTYELYNNNDHPVTAEFYCETDGVNYDNLDFIRTQQSQTTYYCIAFNTADSIGIPVTSPTPPVTPTPPTTPTVPTTPTIPTNPTVPTTPVTPIIPSDTDTINPEQPPVGSVPTGSQPTTQPPVSGGGQPTGNPAEAAVPGLFSDGLQLPPTLVEAISSVLGGISNIGTAIGHGFLPLATGILSEARTVTGQAVSAVATAAGIVATVAAGAAMATLANPEGFSELASLPYRLWTSFLLLFGWKKKSRPWGTVYDSVTKQPIDPAYVVLTNMMGNEVATCITDIDGRYGFSVEPGTYKITVNKTNFTFPSAKLAGKTSDELYNALYFGEPIVVTEQGQLIANNIPLDQLNFDWNEFAKNEQHRLSYYRHSDLVIARLANLFFWLGWIIATVSLIALPNIYNAAIFAVYIVMFILRSQSPKFKAKGYVTELFTEQPLPFAIVHILSAATGQEIIHKVTDRLGNYYCLVPNGTYTVSIDRKNDDGTYARTVFADPVIVKDGYLKQHFQL